MFLHFYFKCTLKERTIFDIAIIIFYDVCSFHLADLSDVSRKTPENKDLLKIKISGEQKW